MSELNWNLLAMPDFAGSAMQGYTAGEKIGKQRRVDDATAAYLAHPDDNASQNAMMAYAPETLGSMLKVRQYQRGAQAREAAAPLVAKGDYQGAAKAVLGSDPESAKTYMDMYKSLTEDQKRITDVGSAAWAAAWPTIKNLPKGTGERQAAYANLVAPHLHEAGAKDDQINSALPNLDSDEWGDTNFRLALGTEKAREADKPIEGAPGTVYRDPHTMAVIGNNPERPPAGFEVDPANPRHLRPTTGGPADPSYIHTTAKDRAEGGREGAPPKFIVFPNGTGGSGKPPSTGQIIGEVLEKFRTGGDAALSPEEKVLKDRYLNGATNGGFAGLFNAPPGGGGGYGGAARPVPAAPAAAPANPRAAPPAVVVQRPPAARPSAPAGPARIQSQADFDRLPVGSKFVDPATGRVGTKRR